MSQKKPSPKPVWWKNTYFWIAAILLLVGLAGLPFLGSDAAIRDPGQKRESNLWLMYIVASVLMFANGWLSHGQTVRAYEEENAA
ncbi:hypothetical protein EON79_18260 [bacterium]|nr:MAG: hypothetical protein EON79_18260 [bacterium]